MSSVAAPPPSVAFMGAATTMYIGGAGTGPLANAVPTCRSGSSDCRSSGGRHHDRGPRLVGATTADRVWGSAHRRQVKTSRAGATTPPGGAGPAAAAAAFASRAGASEATRPSDRKVIFWVKRGWDASSWRTLPAVRRVATTVG